MRYGVDVSMYSVNVPGDTAQNISDVISFHRIVLQLTIAQIYLKINVIILSPAYF